MNTQVIRAMWVMAPNDARLIWRDGFLLTFLSNGTLLAGGLIGAIVSLI